MAWCILTRISCACCHLLKLMHATQKSAWWVTVEMRYLCDLPVQESTSIQVAPSEEQMVVNVIYRQVMEGDADTSYNMWCIWHCVLDGSTNACHA